MSWCCEDVSTGTSLKVGLLVAVCECTYDTVHYGTYYYCWLHDTAMLDLSGREWNPNSWCFLRDVVVRNSQGPETEFRTMEDKLKIFAIDLMHNFVAIIWNFVAIVVTGAGNDSIVKVKLARHNSALWLSSLKFEGVFSKTRLSVCFVRPYSRHY